MYPLRVAPSEFHRNIKCMKTKNGENTTTRWGKFNNMFSNFDKDRESDKWTDRQYCR